MEGLQRARVVHADLVGRLVEQAAEALGERLTSGRLRLGALAQSERHRVHMTREAPELVLALDVHGGRQIARRDAPHRRLQCAHRTQQLHADDPGRECEEREPHGQPRERPPLEVVEVPLQSVLALQDATQRDPLGRGEQGLGRVTSQAGEPERHDGGSRAPDLDRADRFDELHGERRLLIERVGEQDAHLDRYAAAFN